MTSDRYTTTIAAVVGVALGIVKLAFAATVVPNYPMFRLIEIGVVVATVLPSIGVWTTSLRKSPLASNSDTDLGIGAGLGPAAVIALLIVSLRFTPSLRFAHPFQLDVTYVLASLQGFVALAVCCFRCPLPAAAAVAATLVAHHWVAYAPLIDGGVVLSALLSVVTVLLVSSLRFLRVIERQRNESVESAQREARLNERLATLSGQIVENKRRESISLLAAGLAHEVNNPLHHMKGNLRFAEQHVEGILAECRSPAPADHSAVESLLLDLSRILVGFRSGLDRLAEVVTGLRSVSQNRGTSASATDVASACRRVVQFVGTASSGRISYHIDVEPGLRVACNETDFFTVVSNLFVNAIDAIDGEGTVAVHGARAGSIVRIDVQDSGAGIPSDEIGRVFEPFYTSKSMSGSGDDDGHLGVGLSLCRSIVENLGGTIAIDSTEGVSTCVTLKLPLADT